jgi:hypothetical protein
MSMTAKPIHVYLKPEQDRALRASAARLGTSIAELVRRSVDAYLVNVPVEQDPLTQVVGLGRSGRGDLSERHDEFIAAATR